MLYGKGIVGISQQELRFKERLERGEFKDYTEKRITMTLDIIRKHTFTSDLVDYTFEDTWKDGTPKRLHEIYVSYEPVGGQTMVYQLGVDLIHLVSLELAKLTDLPFGSSKPEEYGHHMYVFPHWGTCANGTESLNVVFYTQDSRQRTFEFACGFRSTPPEREKDDYGDFHYEKDSMWREDEIKGFRKHIRPYATAFKPLKLQYFNERTVSAVDGPVTLPKQGTIEARVLQDYVKAIAAFIFGKHYDFKAVPRC